MEKPNTLRIANNNKEEFDKMVNKLVSEGWVVEKTWEKYACYFAVLRKEAQL